MTEAPSRPISTPRAAIAGLSALLVVSVLLGTSLQAAQPTLRDAVPNTARDRMPVRQLTLTLAKAVRELVGDHHKPALQGHSFAVFQTAEAVASLPACVAHFPAQRSLVRVALLNLPPPALA